MKSFPKIALQVPEILLPAQGVDMARWAVVACDQYTSQPEYWRQVDAFAGEKPSTLRLMLPEVYLGKPEEAKLVAGINSTMRQYLDNGVLQSCGEGFILVERKTAHGKTRMGLVVALDLEAYDYSRDSQTLIRATEGTIVDRLPPRIKVREGACLELPHIMVLIDDPERTVIEPLCQMNLPKVYDFDLMQKSGRITGRKVADSKAIAQVASALEKIGDKAAFNKRYGTVGKEPLLYAMGDGNHSFATAKAIWEKLKASAKDQASVMEHPARYALVELVNVHDSGLEFEPIHRVLFKADFNHLLQELGKWLHGVSAQASVKAERFAQFDEAMARSEKMNAAGRQAFACVTANGCAAIEMIAPGKNLVVANLQDFLDQYLAGNKAGGMEIDYIHGRDVVEDLGAQPGNVGFFLPPVDKGQFFRTIILDGVFPRKTFSMGEADEKRFYLECRRITR